MTRPTFDVVIAGAGIIGTACAWKAAQAGLRVLLVEPGEVAAGTTGAAMGHILVMDDSQPQLALTRLSCQRWRELAEMLPVEVEFRKTGTLWLAETEEQLRELKNKKSLLDSLEVASQLVDSRELHEAEPLLAPHLIGGLLVPDDAVLYPPAAAAWFLSNARRLGTRLLLGKRIVETRQWQVRLDDNQWMNTRICLVASGWQSAQLLPRLPIIPRKGHLAITDRTFPVVSHQLVEAGYHQSVRNQHGSSIAFNVQPRITGQLLIGSSRQQGDASSAVEWPVVQRMLARAVQFIPTVARCDILRIWTGVRPATPDGLPLIGPTRSAEGVWLATGHEGLGITTCLATAEMVVACLLGEPPPIPLEPFLPDRFTCR